MHKIAAVALFISLVVASVVAFQLTISIDEAQPAGTQSAFSVTAVNTPTKGVAVDAISSTADNLNLNIFKVQPAPQDSTKSRILFAFIGNSTAFESHGGFDYPAFSAQGVTTKVAPASRLTTEDLRGRYVTDATAGQMTSLLALLGNKGIEAKNDTVGLPSLLIYSVQRGNLAGSFVIVALALGLATFYSVTRNRKVHALKDLHGYRRLANLRTEVFGATATFVVGAASLLLIVLPLLAVYNHFHQGIRFFSVLGVTMAVVYMAVVVLVAIGMWLLPRIAIPQVLKGEQGLLRNGVLAAVAQVAILAIVLATTSASMNRVEAINASLGVSDFWSQGAPLYALRLGVSGSHEDDVRDSSGFAAVVTDMERANQALLVSYAGQGSPDDTTAPDGPEGNNSLIANNEYLERQVVRSDEGQRITALQATKDAFTLLIPRSYNGDPQELLQKYSEYFRGFACTIGRSDDDKFSCDPQGSIVFTQPGQDLFTFSGTSFFPAELQRDPLFLKDPIIAVVSANSGLISPFQYFSYASQDDVLFSDPAALRDALQRQGISGSFQGIDNAADAVATSRALSKQELRMDAFSLPLGWAVLILASSIMAMVYCDRRKRPMFVELIHGYSFTSRHWRYLVAGSLLSLAGIGVAAVAGKNLTSGREITAAGALFTAQLVITLAAVKIYESRFRADFIKRY